jgi:hypothetical protein
MAKRTIQRDPELLAHQQWLGYLQPVGLVVAPAAMQEAGWVVTRSGSELIERQERYREALEALGGNEDGDADDRVMGSSSIEALLVDHLGWSGDQIQSAPNLIEEYTRELPELGETLQPTALVPAASGEGVQLLVQELPLLTPLDQKFSGGDQHWRASSQERFERLLRETGVEAGLLFNGSQLRLVVAPKGESSGHLTFTLKDLAEVSGRLMFSGLDLLLGQSHVFLDPDGYRLADVLGKSRSFQALVSNALADQVFAALWDLLRGFQHADELTQHQGGALLEGLAENDPKQLYGGLITVLMRLVFLLYAEDNALLPKDAVYEQNYKVSGVFERLEQDAVEFPDTMEQRYGAWAGLMSLCQLIFAGGGAKVDYLPARQGELFDPTFYPWLETPWISDGIVLSVLSNLLMVNGERISYRSLDVEQIGSVYEEVMGFEVTRVSGRSLGLKSNLRSGRPVTTVVDLDLLLSSSTNDRNKMLSTLAQVSLPPRCAAKLQRATNIDELLDSLESRVNTLIFDSAIPAGSLALNPTEERKKTGSHYTPRSLTRPTTIKAIEPLLQDFDTPAKPDQILSLKVCDLTMGSGAFLVETCRYLAEQLNDSWNTYGLPPELPIGEEPLIYARRIVAQKCIYGLDKNPFAVSLAKLSIWLLTLSRDAPFTFLDHALKEGDSLMGASLAETSKYSDSRQLAMVAPDFSILRSSSIARNEAFGLDSRSDSNDSAKRKSLLELETLSLPDKIKLDLVIIDAITEIDAGKEALILEYLNKSKSEQMHEIDFAMGASIALRDILTKSLNGGKAFHWEIEFPEVFSGERNGFDCIVGNPPFYAGAWLTAVFGKEYRKSLVSRIAGGVTGIRGTADLCSYFILRSKMLLRNGGTAGLVLSSTIAEGDSMEVGTKQLCDSGATIYYVQPKFKWPGNANVEVVTLCFYNGEYKGPAAIGPTHVSRIYPDLTERQRLLEPLKLQENIGLVCKGHELQGNGFKLNEDEYESIVLSDPYEKEVIRPLIIGEDLNSEPSIAPSGWVICFGNSTEEYAKRYSRCYDIVKERVKPERDEYTGSTSRDKYLRTYWWRFRGFRPDLEEYSMRHNRLLAICVVSKHLAFTFIPSSWIATPSICCFLFHQYSDFALLQSQVHLAWARRGSSTLGKTSRYISGRCFDTFPFPINSARENLGSIGEEYFAYRSLFMKRAGIGMTEAYNMLNDPNITDADVIRFREIQKELDFAVLDSYGIPGCRDYYGFHLQSNGCSRDAEGEQEAEYSIIIDERESNKLLADGGEGHIYYGFSPDAIKIISDFLLVLNLERSSGGSGNSKPGMRRSRKSQVEIAKATNKMQICLELEQ